MGIHFHWNTNIPITQTANSHKSETLLASRNTSHNPKHFSQSETLLANRNTSRPHRDLNPGLTAPQFTALSTRPLATFCHMRWRKVNLNHLLLKVRFTQKMLVKLSHHHSSEPFFAPGLLFPVNGMNSSDKMSIFSFFCINQINLLKLIQICTHVIINNFIALQAL